MHHQPSETTSLMLADSVDGKSGSHNRVCEHQRRMLAATDHFDKSSNKARDKSKNKALAASVVDGNQEVASVAAVAKSDGLVGVIDGDNGSWFKAAQLVTEILLMLFVSGLLLIAAVVIFSKKSPEFMESYEILPKTLFILCIVVAILSFLHWLYIKTMRLIKRHCCHQDSSAIYNLVTTQPEIVLLPRIGMTTITTTTRIESSKSNSSHQAVGVYIEQEKEPLNPVGATIINEE